MNLNVKNSQSWLKKTMMYLLGILLFCSFSDIAQAQFVEKWLSVGSLHHNYSSGGAREESGSGLFHDGLYQHRGHFRSSALWILTKNWDPQDVEDRDVYDYKGVHLGPRDPGFGQMFGVELSVISKYQPPLITVDGLETFNRPVTNDSIDINQPGDRMIKNIVNTAIGLTIERKIMQFSNQYHDNYHIQDFLFTNTGNVDDDPGAELEGQTLEDVYIMYLNRYKITGEAAGMPGGTDWGRNSIHDVVGDGYYNYGVDFKAVYAWQARYTEWTAWDNIGGPVIDDRGWDISSGDTIGRLVAATMVGRQTLHADNVAKDNPDSGYPLTDNWPDQPVTTTFMDTDIPLTTVSDQFDEGRIREEYEKWATAGNVQPFHAATVEPAGWDEGQVVTPKEWREHYAAQTNRPDYVSVGGFQNVHAYGPYDIEFGQSVRILLAEGVGALSREATFEIGRAYKDAWEDDDDYRDIAYDANNDGIIQGLDVAAPDTTLPLYSFPVEYSEYMNKNEWTMTARDSLFQTFMRAKANYESGFDIPQAPLPPKTFTVTSGSDQIILDWDVYTDSEVPEGNTAEPTSHWEIWRGEASIDSFFVKVAEPDPSARSYTDVSAIRGINYYYFIQAVDDPVTDNITWPGQSKDVVLKSNRHFTQTYAPASLKRGPGTELEQVRVVPNPYNLAADRNIRWPDLQDKLGFLNIPGECTIKIYTEAGELVRTLEHTDGSGDEYWQLTTESNQLVVSGIYFAVITDNTEGGFGDSIIRKFTIIR